MKRTLNLALCAAMIAAGAPRLQAQRSLSNADQISAAQLKAYLTFVASDEMEGRNTPSRGLDTTALFISTLLTRWGAKPMGDNGTYFQKISLVRYMMDPAKTRLDFTGGEFKQGTDYFSIIRDGAATAPAMWGGDGWLVKSKNRDAYSSLDPKGKIVILPYSDGSTPPKGLTRADLTGKQGTDWAGPTEYATSKGAAGILFVVPAAMDAQFERLQSMYGTDYLYMEKFKGPAAKGIPIFYIKQKVAEAILKGSDSTIESLLDTVKSGKVSPSFDIKGLANIELSAVTTAERKTTQNVVAAFEGSDPSVKDEYVAFGAHYDHIGMLPYNPNGDYIYNGADDDGSGTVSLISMAEALSKAKKRPRRNTLFVWHCGEEKGLWGSQYFTSFPTVPLKQIVTQLNIDMVGRSKLPDDTAPQDRELSGPNEIYVIGSEMMSSQLGTLSKKVNNEYLKVAFNYRYDDPKDPNGFFFRSDHFNYARHGVPIIFYFDGVHVDYHGLGDEVSKIDFQKMEKVVRTVYTTMWEISGLAKRPVIDRKLPFAIQ
jgi:Zn-dependent M28 family amino/carboxypeptidase